MTCMSPDPNPGRRMEGSYVCIIGRREEGGGLAFIDDNAK